MGVIALILFKAPYKANVVQMKDIQKAPVNDGPVYSLTNEEIYGVNE